MDAIISIHDVMPETLDRVCRIVEEMPPNCRENLTLLIVPGLDWRASEVDVLKSMQRDGLLLAGHGWTHEAAVIDGWYHRLHSLLISRGAAEHLPLSTEDILQLIERNFCWFVDHGFDSPDLYVPPAWAMGRVSQEQLATSPYRYFETTSGLMDAKTGKKKWLPLVGFEADNQLRRYLLRASNLGNELLTKVVSPLRVSIHPYDLEHLIASNLRALVSRIDVNLHYASVF